MSNIIIRNRWNGSVIYDGDITNLRGANLRGANLRCANLRGANLSDADLRGADLSDADLRGADLRGADLSYADLRGADLSDSDLRGANLRGANLRGANLRGAKNAPLIVNGLRWVVQISGTGWMQIGCQRHSVIEWDSFDDDRISLMADDALTFWRSYKQMLIGLCATWVHADETK